MSTLLKKIDLKQILYFMINKIFGLKNIIIFKGQNDFQGNAYALYEYLLKKGYDKKYKMVWNIDHYDSIKRFDHIKCEIILADEKNSIKKQYYNACAKFVFYENDCPIFRRVKGQRAVYLSHGCPPIKNATGMIDIKDEIIANALITSENIRDLMADIRKFPAEKMFVCGHPRNDAIFDQTLLYRDILEKKYKKIILWMPTFRKSNIMQYGQVRDDSEKKYIYGLPLIHEEKDLLELNNLLSDKDVLLIIKPHPRAAKEGIDKLHYSNISVWTDEYLIENNINIYRLFHDTDAMISDYSSVVFDYMLTDHPLGYIVDDINSYKLGFAYDNVQDYMPGKKINKMDDLLGFIDDISNEVDEFKEERRKINLWANDYQDGNNCERIVRMFDL
ncbi:MAG: CDP-glycerol glycerophosphotransferase family protein [Eubacterium sp.]